MKKGKLTAFILGGLGLILLLFSGASALAGRGFNPMGLLQSQSSPEAEGTLPLMAYSSELPASFESPENTETHAAAATEDSSTQATESAESTDRTKAAESSSETELSTEVPTETSADTTAAPSPEQTPPAASTEASTEAPVVPSTTPSTDPPTVPSTVPPTIPPTVPPTAPPTEAPTLPPEPFYPEDLLAHLSAAGQSPESLAGSQLLVVRGLEKPKCILYAYEKGEKGWRPVEGLYAIPGIMGRDGMNDHTPEDHKYTPIGYFALGPAYGEREWQETGLEYIQIQYDYYYVVDPNSKYYNQLYRNYFDDKDWEYAEEMISMLEYYEYCIYVQHNVNPIIPNEGSAIFVHIDRLDNSTSGCVGVEKWVMQALFKWMRKEADPHILLYPGQ